MYILVVIKSVLHCIHEFEIKNSFKFIHIYVYTSSDEIVFFHCIHEFEIENSFKFIHIYAYTSSDEIVFFTVYMRLRLKTA